MTGILRLGFCLSSGSTLKPASLAAATNGVRAFDTSVSSCRYLVHVASACRQAVSCGRLGHLAAIKIPIMPETVVANRRPVLLPISRVSIPPLNRTYSGCRWRDRADFSPSRGPARKQ